MRGVEGADEERKGVRHCWVRALDMAESMWQQRELGLLRTRRSRGMPSWSCCAVSYYLAPGHHPHTHANKVLSKIVLCSNRQSSEHAHSPPSKSIAAHAPGESSQSNSKTPSCLCVSHITSSKSRMIESRAAFWLQKQQYHINIRSDRPACGFRLPPLLPRSSYQTRCQCHLTSA